MLGRIDRALAYYHVCLTFKDGAYQLLYIRSAVLVIGIRVYNDIRSVSEACIYPRHKALGKSLVLRKTHDIVDTPVPGDLNRVVDASVIYYQYLDFIYPVYMLWQIV